MLRKLKINILAIFTAILISIIYSIPSLIGYINSNEKHVFTGNSFLWDPWDINVYVSVIKYSQSFGFAFQNLYTIEQSSNKVVVYPLYSLLGTFIKRVDPFVVYNVSIFFTTLFLFYSIYFTAHIFTKNKKKSIICGLISIFGGGLGWLLISSGIPSPDLTVTPFILTNALQRPHTSLSLGFYLLSIGLLYKFHKDHEGKDFIYTVICILLSSIIYPYLLLSFLLMAAALSGLTAIKNKKLILFFKNMVIVIPVLVIGGIYSMYFLRVEGMDNVISPSLKTPNFPLFLMGIGTFCLPLILGVKMLIKKEAYRFLYLWIFIDVMLAYLPLGFGRYYFLGIFVPLSILLVSFLENFNPKTRFIFAPVIIIFSTLTGVIVLFYRISSTIDVNGSSYWHKNDTEVISYIRKNLTIKDNVLSTYPFANIIPTFLSVHVFFGHYYQTPNSAEKLSYLKNFYGNHMPENTALEFLKEKGISYIIWTSINSDWPNTFLLDMPKYSFLKEVFKNETYSIYTY